MPFVVMGATTLNERYCDLQKAERNFLYQGRCSGGYAGLKGDPLL